RNPGYLRNRLYRQRWATDRRRRCADHPRQPTGQGSVSRPRIPPVTPALGPTFSFGPRQRLRIRAYNVLPPPPDAPAKSEQARLRRQTRFEVLCHETIASPEDGPAADDDTPAATSHTIAPALYPGSPAGNPGGAGHQSHARARRRGGGLRRLRPDGRIP